MLFDPFVRESVNPNPTPSADKLPARLFSPFADDRNYLTPPRTPISFNTHAWHETGSCNNESAVSNSTSSPTFSASSSSSSSSSSQMSGRRPLELSRPSPLRKPHPHTPIARHYLDLINKDLVSSAGKESTLFTLPSSVRDRLCNMGDENVAPRISPPNNQGCRSPVEFGPNWGSLPSRYLYIRNLPRSMSVWTLREIFKV